MTEEQKWEEQTTHVLCANNCGFFGSPTTLNLCSKCYKDHRLKEHQTSTAKIAVRNSLTVPEPSSATVPNSVFPISNPTEIDLSIPISIPIPATDDKLRQPNRCGSCRKRVGLTGFTCKCGMTFCGDHRYPEKHECSFDYKTEGKEAIARANPVVKGVKLMLNDSNLIQWEVFVMHGY